MRSPLRSAVVAVVLDAVCLIVFVLAGRQSHGLDSGAGWFLAVLWPIALGWFAVAVVAGLYRAAAHRAARLAATLLLGVGLGLVMRAAVTHRDTPPAFILVAYGFITLTTVGWRLAQSLVPRLLGRNGAQGGN